MYFRLKELPPISFRCSCSAECKALQYNGTKLGICTLIINNPGDETIFTSNMSHVIIYLKGKGVVLSSRSHGLVRGTPRNLRFTAQFFSEVPVGGVVLKHPFLFSLLLMFRLIYWQVFSGGYFSEFVFLCEYFYSSVLQWKYSWLWWWLDGASWMDWTWACFVLGFRQSWRIDSDGRNWTKAIQSSYWWKGGS